MKWFSNGIFKSFRFLILFNFYIQVFPIGCDVYLKISKGLFRLFLPISTLPLAFTSIYFHSCLITSPTVFYHWFTGTNYLLLFLQSIFTVSSIFFPYINAPHKVTNDTKSCIDHVFITTRNSIQIVVNFEPAVFLICKTNQLLILCLNIS